MQWLLEGYCHWNEDLILISNLSSKAWTEWPPIFISTSLSWMELVIRVLACYLTSRHNSYVFIWNGNENWSLIWKIEEYRSIVRKGTSLKKIIGLENDTGWNCIKDWHRNRWFWGPIKHDLLKWSVILFSLYKMKDPFCEGEINCINYFYVHRIFHYV